MCNEHQSRSVSRRGFTGLLTAGAGLALLPLPAAAKAALPSDTMGIMCIDHKFVSDALTFFNGPHGPGAGQYDLVALAGASLAAKEVRRSGGAFHYTYQGLREQVLFAKKPPAGAILHPDIKHVVVVDHLGCGAYQDQFPNMQPSQELEHHRTVAREVSAWFLAQRLTIDFWIIPAEGAAAVPLF